MHEDDRDYYAARAATERALAEKASDPGVAGIHAEMAERYEMMLTGEPSRLSGGSKGRR